MVVLVDQVEHQPTAAQAARHLHQVKVTQEHHQMLLTVLQEVVVARAQSVQM